MPGLTWVVALDDVALAAGVAKLRAALAGSGFTDRGGELPAAGDVVVVWADRPLPEAVVEAVLRCGRPVLLAGPTLVAADPEGALGDAAGVVPGPATAVHDIRVRAGRDGGAFVGRLLDHAHAGTAHLGEHTHVRDRLRRIEKVTDDVELLLGAQLGLVEHPVMTWRPAGSSGGGVATWTLGTDSAGVAERGAIRLLLLALRHVLALPTAQPVRVGLLGYGAIGHEHSAAVRHVTGLELAAVCDVSPARLEVARAQAPQLRGYSDPRDLLTDDEVDLVVVSTAPNTHANWAQAALRAGKHVVVEKPFAIRTAEADAVLSLAAERDLLAVVYQNRRFDPDHLAVRRAVTAGLLGELFDVEAFVGGYGHPCNLWHSDREASGGAFYDWGAHVLDQLLDLIPDEIEHVSAAEHKLRWLDVTNADHSRVTVRFVTGAEATFVYSDLAAALKPRWYVLGTQGAIVGSWRTERVVSRTDIGTLAEDVLAPADSPPVLDLHAGDGSVTRLATPAAPPYPFHTELADRLQLGLAATVTGAQSRRVLSVMEAASESAAQGGRPVVPART